MSDRSLLHAAVVAAPEVESARLAYAVAIAPIDPERAERIGGVHLDSLRKTSSNSESRGVGALRAGVLIRARGIDWARAADGSGESRRGHPSGHDLPLKTQRIASMLLVVDLVLSRRSQLLEAGRVSPLRGPGSVRCG